MADILWKSRQRTQDVCVLGEKQWKMAWQHVNSISRTTEIRMPTQRRWHIPMYQARCDWSFLARWFGDSPTVAPKLSGYCCHPPSTNAEGRRTAEGFLGLRKGIRRGELFTTSSANGADALIMLRRSIIRWQDIHLGRKERRMRALLVSLRALSCWGQKASLELRVYSWENTS